MLGRDFKPKALKPEHPPAPVRTPRDLCIAMFTAKIEEALTRTEGVTAAGPKAPAAKRALLRLLPHMLPPEDAREAQQLYRPVLQHDDYGIHNMSIRVDDDDEHDGRVGITSVFDWESACVVPVLLADVDFLVHGRFLAVDADGRPTWRMWSASDEPRLQWHAQNQRHACHYLKVYRSGLVPSWIML